MANPIYMWDGYQWVNYTNGKMWDGYSWNPLKGEQLNTGEYDDNRPSGWGNVGTQVYVETYDATWTQSYDWKGDKIQSPYLLVGLDHSYDGTDRLSVGDSGTVKYSANHYATGEAIPNWVHGLPISIIQERWVNGNRQVLASQSRIYSWFWDWDIQKIKAQNPYGVRQAMVGFPDMYHIWSRMAGVLLLKVELMIYPHRATVGNIVQLATHQTKDVPSKIVADQKVGRWFNYTYQGPGYWVTLPPAYGKQLIDSQGFVLRSDSADANHVLEMNGFNTNQPPQIRVTYEA